MSKSDFDLRTAKALKRSVEILKTFHEVTAIGLSGSFSRGMGDSLSDLDICVFAEKEIPAANDRKHRYEACGISDIAYLNVDFEVSRSDGLKVEGMDCSLIWMTVPGAKEFLDRLTHDFDSDEFLPGGLVTIKSLFDPKGRIEQLKGLVPPYSDDRAMHRVESNVRKAHFSIYVLGWLEKAAVRSDYFSFVKSEYEVLDNFFTALFALNQRWYCDEKRLTQTIVDFELAPANVAERIRSIVMRRDDNADLGKCLEGIKRLFADLETVSRLRYSNVDLPENWQ